MSAVPESIAKEQILTLEAGALAGALAGGIKPRGSTLPIYKHALLVASGGKLSVTTTDSQSTVTISVDAVSAEWSATAAVELLAAALHELTGEVSLRVSSSPTEDNPVAGAGLPGTLLLTSGRRRFSIPCLPPDDFPIPNLGDQVPVETDPAALREAIARVDYAMAKNDVRYYLCGVHLTEGYAVSTNGHRGAVAPAPWGGPDVIIHRDSVPGMLAALGEGATVAVSSNALTVERDGLRFVTLLIDGKYPDWRHALMPAEQDLTPGVTFDPAEMLAAIRRVSPFSMSSDRTPALDISARAGSLVVASIDGKTEDAINCSDGDEQGGRIQSRYLQETCQVAGGAQARWQMKDSNFMFFTIDERNDTHAVMVIRK